MYGKSVPPSERIPLDKTPVDKTWRYLGTVAGMVVETKCGECGAIVSPGERVEGEVYLHPEKPLVAIISSTQRTELIYLPDVDPLLGHAMERMCVFLVYQALQAEQGGGA